MNKLTDLALGIPGIIFDYAGSTAPAGFLLCYGQAVSRTTYAALFDVIGLNYGYGDGSTTFNVPDLRGRSVSGRDDMGGGPANRLNVNTTGTTTAASAVVTAIPSTAALSVGMFAVGPTLPSGVTIASIDTATQVTLSTGVGVTAGTASSIRFGVVDGATLGATGGAQVHTLSVGQMPSHSHGQIATASGSAGASGNPIMSNTSGGGLASGITANTGSGSAHPIMQPTIVLNKIIKT